MTTSPLTLAQLASLDADGYVVVPDAVDAAWLEQLRCAFEAAPAQGDGTQHVALGLATPHPQAWERLRVHPAVRAAALHVLEGASFHVRDLHGRNPLPGYGQQGLHADWMPRASVRPFFVLTALFMFDDFTPGNGATRVVPGSHLLVRAVPRELAQPGARHPQERVVTGAAGSVLVLNGHTWHSGRGNESHGPRRCAQMVIQRS